MPRPCQITQCSVKPLKAVLHQPFRIASGQHDTLDNVLFSITLSDGTTGYGEAAVAPHITGETVAQTTANLKSIAKILVGKEPGNYLEISAFLHAQMPRNMCAVAAVETALLDALTRHLNIPLWGLFGTKPVKLTSGITIDIGSLHETKEKVGQFYQQGFRSFKVKVGRDMDLDEQRVRSVRRLAPRAAIILDANQGYSDAVALRFVKALKRAGIVPVLLEQPVAKNDWEGLKRVSRLSGVPVCADETVSSLKDALRAIHEKVVPVINIKLMKTGIIHSREIAFAARSKGVKLMIGGMMETSLAMTASAHLAAGLGCFDFVDLDTPFFIRNGLKNNPFLSSNGIYDLSKAKAGIGLRP